MKTIREYLTIIKTEVKGIIDDSKDTEQVIANAESILSELDGVSLLIDDIEKKANDIKEFGDFISDATY
jgi:hypothetical protein